MTSPSRWYQDQFASADAPSITHRPSAANKNSEETAKQHFGGRHQNRHQKGHHQEVVQAVASNVDEGEVAVEVQHRLVPVGRPRADWYVSEPSAHHLSYTMQ